MPTGIPELLYISSTGAGVTKALGSQRMGTVLVTNNGPGVVFMAIGDTPPPAATFGDDKKQLTVGETVNLLAVALDDLSFRSVAGPDDVEIIVIPNSGSGSGIL